MQFETIAVVIFALALLVFMYTRRRVITDLQQQNHELAHQVEKLRLVAMRQRDEIDKLIHTAEQERRARQMATLSSQRPAAPPPAPPRPPTSAPRSTIARKQEEATRSDPGPASSWDNASNLSSIYLPSSAPSPTTMAEATYKGGGGSFDGGGASGDYGRSDSGSSSSSSSSDSGSSSSSSSSDSGSSSSSSD